MGKKRKQEEETIEVSDEVTFTDSTTEEAVEQIEEPEKVEVKSEEETMLKATEWARQDPDRPDPTLFNWWDAQGVMPESKYQSIKATVFRKQ